MSLVATAQSSPDLEKVLTQLDTAAANFKSAEADFRWDQYQKVVNETDVQKGKVFFQRHDKNTLMAADILEPDKKILLFNDGRIRFYQPRIDQVTEYEAGTHRDEVESFLVLGFGSRGHDLTKSFTVKYLGPEMVDGVNTAKLELTPKQAKVRGMFERIILWLDTARGVSLKQQAFEPSGDYRIATYTNFKMNSKIPDDTFKLKTTGKTKVVKPQ
jgi:outer membrane lipoprotein-sorting protein